MDRIKHEIIKSYIKESEATGTVTLSAPAVWMDAPMKQYLWMIE